MAKQVPLVNGGFTIVDDEDYFSVMRYRWRREKNGRTYYAVTHDGDIQIRLHRLLFKLKPGDPHVDHRDGDGLNNQRYNIRFANRCQQAQNFPLRLDNKSGIRGVDWHKSRWRVRLQVNKEPINVGRFVSKEDALAARNKAEAEHFKDFAPSLCRAV